MAGDSDDATPDDTCMKEVFSEYAGALWAAVARTTWAAQMGTVKSTKNSVVSQVDFRGMLMVRGEGNVD